MKKSLIVVAAVAVPALIAFGQPAKDSKQPGKPGSTPAATQPGKDAAQPGKDQDAGKPAAPPASKADSALTAEVEKAWAAIAKQDWAAFGSSLSDDFTLVMAMGIQDKTQCLAGLKDMKMTSHTLSDWKTTKLGENAAVVVYKAVASWNMPDGTSSTDTTWCSDAMVRHGGKWQIAMHQETPVQAAGKQP